MIDFLKTLFSADGFMPHGHCYLWRPGVLWLHITSDALIALAYYSIPFTLLYFIRKRRDIPFNWMFLCFAVFIVACGTTHLMEILVIWHPVYWLSGSIKALTALVSVPTAILLMKLLPQALALPSPAVLRVTNAELAGEIAERKRAEAAAQRLNNELEQRVAERTRQLEEANEILTREIFERKRAEAGQERLAAIVNSSDDAIIGKTLGGIITDWNAGAEKLFGYSAAEAIGRPMRFIFPLERVAEETEILARITRGESVKNYETARIRKDGKHVDVSVTVSPILDHTGKIVGASKVARDITERKREVEKTEWLASFPEQNPSPIVEANLSTGHIQYQNPTANRVFPDLQYLGLDHPYLGGLVEVTAPLRSRNIRFLQRDIAVAEQHYAQTITYSQDGQRLRIYGTNITERKLAEAILRESEERYRNLFNTLIEGFCTIEMIFDAGGKPVDFRFLEVNPAFERQTGLHNAQGKLMRDLAPDIEGYWFENYGRIALTGEPAHFENEAKTLGRYYDVCAYRVGGPGSLKVAILFNDVTERKRMENALQENEKRFRTMANSISQLAWIARADGSITWYNQRWYAYTGTTLEQMEGWGWQSVHDLQRLPEVMTRWQDAIAQGQSFEMEFPLRGADGQFRRFLTLASPLRNAEGNVEQWFGTNTDVDELKRAEDEIKVLNTELEARVVKRTAELEAANKELEAFSYSVSHDLRAPLRAINGFAAIVLEEFGPQLPPEARRYLDRVCSGGKRMGELIDDLLSFSRLSRQPLNRQRVDTARVVQEALAEAKSIGTNRPVETHIGDLPPCMGDPALVKQVWVNLLSNALKYSRDRAPAIVEAGCEQIDGKTVYFVRDNGVGFDMQYAGKLFGVFQRLHRSDEFEGTGVGLAIVQRIVHRHGGRVWAAAELDRGATFYFTLEGENT
ncbi:MAG TPA: PAS domain S-box protein [Verrucomicrobiae bacterium]|jgi:PAS domain S-box-containing protein|nr:PAS domain S-box protein [Verrucomicrobiae bacterium]